jgi:hypothetical protein
MQLCTPWTDISGGKSESLRSLLSGEIEKLNHRAAPVSAIHMNDQLDRIVHLLLDIGEAQSFKTAQG